jgi:hypothetical protein
MKISCPYCLKENEIQQTNCAFCEKKLDFSEDQTNIRSLKIQLLDLKEKFTSQYNGLLQKVELAERQLSFLQKKQEYYSTQITQKNENSNFIVPEKITETNLTIENEIPQEQENKEAEIAKLLEWSKQREKEKAEEYQRQQEKHKQETEFKKQEQEKYYQKQQEYQKANKQKQEAKQKAKAEAQAAFMASINNFFITTLAGTFLAPLAQFWAYLTDLYAHYKAQDKLPAFFMTVGGIVALLFGFGYLMQFIDGYYFEIIKIAGTFSTTVGLVAAGVFLHKKEQKYHDFGSALQGLGVSLNFLLIYFLSYSEFFTFFANYPFASVALIIANTILAFILAMKFETKVVLIVTLFGGAFAPFYLQSNVISIYYFLYLWLLAAIMVLIALEIKWKTAGTLAFLVTAVVIEIVIFGTYRQFLPIGSLTIIVMAFAYLFFFFALYDRNNGSNTEQRKFVLKETLTAPDIFNLAGNAALLVSNLFAMYNGIQGLQTILGYVYLLNAAIFLFAFFILRAKLTSKMQVLLMIIVGSFVGFAIPQLFNQNISGLFWSLEGLALVFCGFMFALADVRKEGYFVLFLGLAKIIFSFPDILTNWQLALWTDGYINLLYGGIVLISTVLLLKKFENQTTNYEKYLCYLSLETLSFWAIAVLWIGLHFYFPIFSYNFMLLFAYLCIAWAYRNRLYVSEWLGFAVFGFLVLGYLQSVAVTGNAIFRFQTTAAQIAAVELFLSLWFLQFFYQKILANLPRVANNEKVENQKQSINEHFISNLQNIQVEFTKILRTIFYVCLPVLILPSVFRFYPDYVPLALFTSVFIAFVVAEITKEIAVKIELHILLAFATLQLFQTPTNLMITISAIGVGLATLLAILIYSKGYLREDNGTNENKNSKFSKNSSPNVLYLKDFLAYKLVNSFTFYFIGIVIFLGISQVMNTTINNNFATPFLATGLYFGILIYFRDVLVPLQSNYKFAYRLGTFLVLLGLLQYFGIVYFNQTSTIISNMLFTSLLLLISLFIYTVYIYRKNTLYPMQAESVVWNLDLIGIHFAILLSYALFLQLIFTNKNTVYLTIAFTIHALILLFHSTAKAYSFSLKIALALFACALYKLYAIDMANAETPQKVIVFMVIGVLMLLSSFLFMRFKEKK